MWKWKEEGNHVTNIAIRNELNCFILVPTIDMGSLDGVFLEDLMKLCSSNLKPLLWNHSYIDEVMEI